MARTLQLSGIALVMAIIFSAPAGASPLFLDDWGISYGHWTPAQNNQLTVNYVVEDWTSGNNGYLGPGYGGDEYDVEATYLGFDDDNYYLAVVTGFPMQGRDGWGGHYYEHYDPGDLALDLNNDGHYDAAVDVSANGKLRLENLVWQNPLIEGHQAWGGVTDPLRVSSWSLTKSIEEFRYGSFSGRYAIEAVIDRDDLDTNMGTPMKLHWTMGCGNDVGETTVNPVPEPASLLLLGAGLTMAGMVRKLRSRA